ncbi:MAG TPA: PIN domain-containing protein [Bryobacteraceae bacterium]|nr:PIN domain-containing protein [Bryobacteraceae bacterium]
MRTALDTNVLVYAEGANGAIMRDKALKLIQGLPPGDVVLPAQTLGELFNVLVRKARRRPARAREAVLSWRDAYAVVETSAGVIVNATDLASDHGLTGAY